MDDGADMVLFLDTGETAVLASAGSRLGARLIDTVLMTVAALALLALGLFGTVLGDAVAIWSLLTAMLGIAVVVGLYEIALTAIWGQTLGKRIVGIRVANADHGWHPGWAKSLGRWAVPTALNFIPFIGWLLSLVCYISLLWGPDRQGWHDRVSGTLVIRA